MKPENVKLLVHINEKIEEVKKFKSDDRYEALCNFIYCWNVANNHVKSISRFISNTSDKELSETDKETFDRMLDISKKLALAVLYADASLEKANPTGSVEIPHEDKNPLVS